MSNISFKDHLLLASVTSSLTDEIGYMFKASDSALMSKGILVQGNVNLEKGLISLKHGENFLTPCLSGIQSFNDFIGLANSMFQVFEKFPKIGILIDRIAPAVFADEEMLISIILNKKTLYSFPIAFTVEKLNKEFPFHFRKKNILYFLKSRNPSLKFNSDDRISIVFSLSKISKIRDAVRPHLDDLGKTIFSQKNFNSIKLRVKSCAALSYYIRNNLIGHEEDIADIEHKTQSKNYSKRIQEIILNIESNLPMNEFR
jgi:hypothetical protein